VKLVDEGMADLFGTEPHKLHRRDGPQTSKAAAHAVNTKGLEFLVLKTIGDYSDGCIQDDVLDSYPHKPYSSVTARFKSLEEKGMITTGPDTRPGKAGKEQQVRRVTEFGRRILA
jgi:hypothetical protein